MTSQRILPFQFQDQASFDNFLPGDNVQVVHALQSLSQQSGWECVYLSGPSGVGKSHLVQAACAFYIQHGWRVCYFNLSDVRHFGPQILQGLEQYDLVALEDCHQVAGDAEWEEALFGCYNVLFESARTFILTATERPSELGFQLADLVSRMQSAVMYALKPLGDEEKVAVLQQRAAATGLVLSREVGDYLLHHYQRNLPELLKILSLLDEASLATKRRLTIPFVRSVLSP